MKLEIPNCSVRQLSTGQHSTNATTDPAHPLTEPIWGGENDGIPSWLQGARWDRPTGGGPRWAVTLRIDLALTGLNIDTAGSAPESEAGDASVGGAQSTAGTSNSSAGSAAAAASSAGSSGTGNAGAGSVAAPPPSDKGSTCAFRRAERHSSRLADFAALLALGVALRRRRRRNTRCA